MQPAVVPRQGQVSSSSSTWVGQGTLQEKLAMLAMWALGPAASLVHEASQAAESQSLAALVLASIKCAPQSFHAVAGADILAVAKAVQAELPVSQLLGSLLCKQGGDGCLSLQAAQVWCML